MDKYDSLLAGTSVAEKEPLRGTIRTVEWMANQSDDIRLEIKGNQMIVTFGKTAKERRAAKRAEMRNEWIHKWYQAYLHDGSAWLKDDDETAKGVKHISVVREDKEGFSEITGHAYANPNDKYSAEVGAAIAYARTQGIRCPWYI